MALGDDPAIAPGAMGPNAARRIGGPAGGRWLVALVTFVLGLVLAGLLGWLVGADFTRIAGLSIGTGHGGTGGAAPMTVRPTTSTAASAAAETAVRGEAVLTGRLAALEQRLDRVDLRVDAASGNAARAEALLVAFATRRVVERGAPLGYLADQLKLRFGDAQPRAVATIVADARDMVPLDQLSARLEALAPQLTDSGRQTLWTRATRQLSELFVVRRDRPTLRDSDRRLDQARQALAEGRIDDALADVQHLAKGTDVSGWSAAARRYRDVEAALDLIDSTALMQPRLLHDGGGNTLNRVAQ